MQTLTLGYWLAVALSIAKETPCLSSVAHLGSAGATSHGLFHSRQSGLQLCNWTMASTSDLHGGGRGSQQTTEATSHCTVCCSWRTACGCQCAAGRRHAMESCRTGLALGPSAAASSSSCHFPSNSNHKNARGALIPSALHKIIHFLQPARLHNNSLSANTRHGFRKNAKCDLT